MKNDTTGKARIDFLKQKEREIRAALASEQMKLAKRHKRETEKLESVIGAAVLKTATVSPQFKLMIVQTALSDVDDKTRRFLVQKGWL
jgi:hypothetical protein